MARIAFYEKPGCGGNARQKQLLRAAGHTLDVRDLLRWPWTRETLLEFLAPLPVAQWFNRAAPAVTSGRIDPDTLDPEAAIAWLLAEPLLIRRPLMATDTGRLVGFDMARVHDWVGLGANAPPTGQPGPTLEGCPTPRPAPACAPPRPSPSTRT